MATKTLEIQMEKGYYLSWFVTTQAATKITVSLKDEKKTYFRESKQSIDIHPPLAIGSGYMEGETLKVTIEANSNYALLGMPHSNDIVTSEGRLVGKEFTLCIEDYIDNDYNDVAISVIGWKKRG